ncbi:MAG: 1-deoxy-D-xylulose-5-phosphate reductoisomerase [Clostridiales bacterium GWF2_36_10]|nr:MAG: 1-deoxy-D-xylulose-5-phosphate reductoisomerase [Clostridiales bacterium GWF2_36_10]HAN21315.1 1-deoxy-D-xylulose-5-phosphate reductoisomerase [Clostridiales bacterium]
MVKDIVILGSTGSIGTQALEVAKRLDLNVKALSGYNNDSLLEEQCRLFKPEFCWVCNEKYNSLKIALADTKTKVITGDEALETIAFEQKADLLLNSLMGIRGLKPTLAAIESGRQIALANKETLVAGGEVVIKRASDKGIKILPVDSEHSAIFQCLQGGVKPKKILLTASGGPFYGKKRAELENITPADALKHPNWSMGAKITIDSSTLMNKGLELIEAVHLFSVAPEDIEVIIHRESIIHSMVEFSDNAVIAQLAKPDMRLCIQYALTYPDRLECSVERMDFCSVGAFTFAKPDEETFTLLPLAREAIKKGGNLPAAVNGANEAAVALFLNGKIKYLDIFDKVQRAYENSEFIKNPTIDDIMETDKAAREFVNI